MKMKILVLLLLCTIGTQINAEIVEVEPQGEYAKITENNKESFALSEILGGIAKGDKKEAALKIERNLGSQMPPAIFQLAKYYLSQGDLETAALYHRFGLFRAIIDTRASNDVSLGDVTTIMSSWIGEELSKRSANDQEIYIDNLKKVTKRIIALDKDTPRNYDVRWASLHSIGVFTNAPLNYPNKEGLQKIIEEEREAYIAAAKKDELW